MDLQPSICFFNNGGLSGIYTFSFAGVSSATTPQSEVGEFRPPETEPSVPTVHTSGEMDINNGGRGKPIRTLPPIRSARTDGASATIILRWPFTFQLLHGFGESREIH